MLRATLLTFVLCLFPSLGMTQGTEFRVLSGADFEALPDTVDAINAEGASSEALERLLSLKTLVSVKLDRCELTAGYIKALLAGNPSLRQVSLSNVSGPDTGDWNAVFAHRWRSLTAWDYYGITSSQVDALTSNADLVVLDLNITTQVHSKDEVGDPFADICMRGFERCRSLEVLRLRNRWIPEKGFLRSLRKCKALRELDLLGCPCVSFVGLMPALGELKQLEVLRIGRSSYPASFSLFRSDLTAAVVGVATLRIIEIWGEASFCDELCAAVRVCSKLEQVLIRGCPVTDVGIHWLSQLPNLQILDVIDCVNLSQDFAASLKSARKLWSLAFGGSFAEFRGNVTQVLHHVAGNSTIRDLTVGARVSSVREIDDARPASNVKTLQFIGVGAFDATQRRVWAAMLPSVARVILFASESDSIDADFLREMCPIAAECEIHGCTVPEPVAEALRKRFARVQCRLRR